MHAFQIKLWWAKHYYLTIFFISSTGIILNYLGIYAYIFAQDYSLFSYPYEGDVQLYIKQIKSGKQPDKAPINVYNYTFLLSNNSKCIDNPDPGYIRLILLIKSAMGNFKNRNIIRRSWGSENRFPNETLRRVFLLGTSNDTEILDKIRKESEQYGDIVQSDFIDTYFNNTIKTMQGFKWVVEKCFLTEYVMFSDDDMYVSMKNIFHFLSNPLHYPKTQNCIREVEMLFAGYVRRVTPNRIKFSKWYVSLTDYPFSKYPPFTPAGAYIMSYKALLELYYWSMYTKHFPFDDVYLGIVAKKAGVVLTHNENFRLRKKNYGKHSYKYGLAGHGYKDLDDMLNVWYEQKQLGCA